MTCCGLQSAYSTTQIARIAEYALLVEGNSPWLGGTEPAVLALPAGRIFALVRSAGLDRRCWCGSGDFSAVWVILGLSPGFGGGRPAGSMVGAPM
jgi:hypothetical protein